jgi:hypothetical protein
MKSAEEDPGSEHNVAVDDDEVEEQLGRGARSRAKVINLISVVEISPTPYRLEIRGWQGQSPKRLGRPRLTDDGLFF